MVVGGLAVQIHIMDMTIKASLSPDCDHFRLTDDIDMSFPPMGAEELRIVVEGMPDLEVIVGDNIVLAELTRAGVKKPMMELTECGDAEDLTTEVRLNISSGPEALDDFNSMFYRDRFGRREVVSFGHASVDEVAEFPVVSLEDLIVGKAVKGREKDVDDLTNLAVVIKKTGRELDRKVMESGLSMVEDRGKRTDARERYKDFLKRVGKGKKPKSKAPRPIARATAR
jgi:hypothetical protein